MNSSTIFRPSTIMRTRESQVLFISVGFPSVSTRIIPWFTGLYTLFRLCFRQDAHGFRFPDRISRLSTSPFDIYIRVIHSSLPIQNPNQRRNHQESSPRYRLSTDVCYDQTIHSFPFCPHAFLVRDIQKARAVYNVEILPPTRTWVEIRHLAVISISYSLVSSWSL